MWGSAPPSSNPNWQQGSAPPGGYGQQGHNPYGAPPQNQGYGAPPNQGYGAPPNQGYGAPPNQGYNPYGNPAPGAPPPAQYNAPGAPYQQGYYQQSGPPPPPGVSQELWQWFLAVDEDRSGQITANELQRALMNGDWKPFNEETCRLMIGMFDRNRSGTIDVHEFCALWKYVQDWKACFERFDTDRSGSIDVREYHNAITQFGYNLSVDFAQMVVRLFDRQGRGTISFDAFIQSCVMLKSYTDAFRRMDHQQRGVITIQYEQFLEMVLDHVMK